MTEFMPAFCSAADGVLILCLIFLYGRLKSEIDELRCAMSEANLEHGFEIANPERSLVDMRAGSQCAEPNRKNTRFYFHDGKIIDIGPSIEGFSCLQELCRANEIKHWLQINGTGMLINMDQVCMVKEVVLDRCTKEDGE